ncbi:MAG: hypothetical protein ABS79_01835 [Planctomycetes bacterium SCN 63-9]|nr:MAG: hypothetical protein ABS79_01835 [Planctomycetes bacterium SCN 63-9]
MRTRSLPLGLSFFTGILLASTTLTAAPPLRFETQEIDPHVGNVCYAVTTADVNGDGKPDVVAVSEDAVVWYENPSWTKHDIVRGTTAKDNVCIQPHDIDGDGRIDFALGAGWKPPDTKTPSTLQWLGRDKAGKWRIHPIRFEEPTLHRIRWGDPKGTGRKQLIVTPLQGRGTKGPNWGEGQGVRVLVLDVPKDPADPNWPAELADDSLHTIHNLQIIDVKNDGREEILLAAWEGVFVLDRTPEGRWLRTKIGSGNQETKPFKGASEVKLGRLNDNRRDYVATIEPWHGHQVVVYPGKWVADGTEMVMMRQVIAEPVTWGHAVWTANLDDDPDDELIIGQRDPNPKGSAGPRGPGVFLFDPKLDEKGNLTFDRLSIDDGGMGCEDALATDLNGDGRADIIAGGRSTHNVRIYWNRKP